MPPVVSPSAPSSIEAPATLATSMRPRRGPRASASATCGENSALGATAGGNGQAEGTARDLAYPRLHELAQPCLDRSARRGRWNGLLGTPALTGLLLRGLLLVLRRTLLFDRTTRLLRFAGWFGLGSHWASLRRSSIGRLAGKIAAWMPPRHSQLRGTERGQPSRVQEPILPGRCWLTDAVRGTGKVWLRLHKAGIRTSESERLLATGTVKFFNA